MQHQPRDELVRVLEHAIEKEIPIILCGDFNAHSEVWGLHKSDARGRIIEDLLIAYGLCELNEGDTPTWSRDSNKNSSSGADETHRGFEGV